MINYLPKPQIGTPWLYPLSDPKGNTPNSGGNGTIFTVNPSTSTPTVPVSNCIDFSVPSKTVGSQITNNPLILTDPVSEGMIFSLVLIGQLYLLMLLDSIWSLASKIQCCKKEVGNVKSKIYHNTKGKNDKLGLDQTCLNIFSPTYRNGITSSGQPEFTAFSNSAFGIF